MTRPPPGRHPTVDKALHIAGTWYAGHTLDGLPALSYATEVTVTLGRYWPDAPPGLVAAALLHDAPRLAPTGVDVYDAIAAHLGEPVAEAVRQLEYERLERVVPANAPWALHICAARAIVGLRAALRGAAVAADPVAHIIVAVHAAAGMRAFLTEAAPHLRAAMAADLDRLIAAAEAIERSLARLEHAADMAAVEQVLADIRRRLASTDDVVADEPAAPTDDRGDLGEPSNQAKSDR